MGELVSRGSRHEMNMGVSACTYVYVWISLNVLGLDGYKSLLGSRYLSIALITSRVYIVCVCE